MANNKRRVKEMGYAMNYFTVTVTGPGVSEVGTYWPDGAGLSVDIPEGPERAQVESGCRFLAEETAAVSAQLLCGWVVEKGKGKGRYA